MIIPEFITCSGEPVTRRLARSLKNIYLMYAVLGFIKSGAMRIFTTFFSKALM